MALMRPRRRFTTDEYQHMVAAGILTEDERIELLDGEIVVMSPIGSRHAACVRRLNRWLSAQLGDHVLIGIQDPVRLSDLSQPEPDVALLRPRVDDYASGHPGPDDIFTLIEVADSSLATDRDVKLPLYAWAGVAEVWLIDLDGDRIERHTGPGNGAYQQVARAGRGERLASTVLPDLSLEVDALLG